MPDQPTAPTLLAPIDIGAPTVRLLKDPKSERKAIEITLETRLRDDKAVVVLAIESLKAMANIQLQVETMSVADIEREFAKIPVQKAPAPNANSNQP